MVGLLLLKYLEDLSDEKVVLRFTRDPYYQVFCGFTEFSRKLPCDSTELIKFRNHIGKAGFEKVFSMSVALHCKQTLEDTVNIDTTVQITTYKNAVPKAGLEGRAHGLHHNYAQQRYKEITGKDCPLCGGKHQKDMTKDEREIDREARLTISEEMGHGREQIISI